tara:strand:+ start:32727 stop:33296 length:570 start_codon:yes stop_codon:yes gene_type:complete
VHNTERTDAELAVAAAGGEERAFTELMRRYKEPLYRYIHRSMRGNEDAYDVLQEAFTAAWRSIDRYDPSRKFSTWIYHIALNKVRDNGRKRAVRGFFYNAAPLEHPDRPDIADASMNVSDEYEHRAELGRVTELIEALPKKLKEAFTLQVLQDLSQGEVAEILGVSVKAVETRVYRARKILLEQVDAVD